MNYNRTIDDSSVDTTIKNVIKSAQASPQARAAMHDIFLTIRNEASANGASGYGEAVSSLHAPAVVMPSAGKKSGRTFNTAKTRVREGGFFGAPRWAQVCCGLIAAVLCAGGTAYAAVQLGLISLQPQNSYETAVSISAPALTVGDEVTEYKMAIAGLPEDAILLDSANDILKYQWAGGTKSVSAILYLLDTSDPLSQTFVSNSELITVSGKEGALLERSFTGSTTTDRELYLVYPDEQRVLWLWSDSLSSSELKDMAERVTLTPTGNSFVYGASDGSRILSWSELVASQTRVEFVTSTDGLCAAITNERMENLHSVGEQFFPLVNAATESGEYSNMQQAVAATVTRVTTANTLSGLTDVNAIEQEWLDLTRADGTLNPITVDYLKFGDGAARLNEVIASREVPMTLVQVDMQYTNVTDETLYDVLVISSLLQAKQNSDGWVVYDRAASVSGAQDAVGSPDVLPYGSPRYLSIEAANIGEKNHIATLSPGESALVHFAWLVPTEELDTMLLNTSPFGNWYEFDDADLDVGYVDIRQ